MYSSTVEIKQKLTKTPPKVQWIVCETSNAALSMQQLSKEDRFGPHQIFPLLNLFSKQVIKFPEQTFRQTTADKRAIEKAHWWCFSANSYANTALSISFILRLSCSSVYQNHMNEQTSIKRTQRKRWIRKFGVSVCVILNNSLSVLWFFSSQIKSKIALKISARKALRQSLLVRFKVNTKWEWEQKSNKMNKFCLSFVLFCAATVFGN